MKVKQREWVLGGAALLVVILILVAYGVSRPGTPTSAPKLPPLPDNTMAAPLKVVVHESVSGGVYTFSGSVAVPTTCDTLATGFSSSGTSTLQVTLRLTTLKTNGAGCGPQIGGTQNFVASLAPRAGTKVQFAGLIFNNKQVPFTLQTQ